MINKQTNKETTVIVDMLPHIIRNTEEKAGDHLLSDVPGRKHRDDIYTVWNYIWHYQYDHSSQL